MMLSLAMSPCNPALRRSGPGPNLIPNSTFDADTTGWTAGSGGTLSWQTGRARVTNGAAAAGYMRPIVLAVSPGVVYQVDFWAGNLSGATQVKASVNDGATGAFSGGLLNATKAPGTYSGDATLRFTAVSSQATLWLIVNSATLGHYAEFDDVSVRSI